MLRNKRGITLIGLVVTIIVILIIAGVSIMTLTGENGLITRTVTSKKQMEIAEAKERALLDIINWQAEKLGNDQSAELTNEQLKVIIEEANSSSNDKYYSELTETEMKTKNGYIIEYSELYASSKANVNIPENITLTFDANGGIAEDLTKIVNYGQVYGTLPTPTQDGYIFDGWYTQQNGGTKITEETIVDLTEDKTVYAKWSIDLTGVYIDNHIGWGYFDVCGVPESVTSVSVVVTGVEATQISQWRFSFEGTHVGSSGDTNEYYITFANENGNLGSKTVTSTNCFTGDTKVLTSNGLKNIEDINIGDKVLSMKLNTMKAEEKEVTEKFIHETKEDIYDIYIENEIIQATYAHLVFTKNKGWVAVSKLEKGDILIDTDCKEISIQKICKEKNTESFNVYNIEVEDNHTYFVGENNVLVHNYKEPWIPYE